ncbi:MAG: DUF1573 domain-containing protein [Planctomycetaceae bacterium]|nr:DUF1573 domain-containing protein [Planctomycetaceae bacterium]
MYKQTFILAIVSLVLGVALGIGSAFSALTVNAWNPLLEYKKASEIIKEGAEKNSNPNAKAQIEQTVFDFGIKDVKEKGEHNFEIKNVGTATLTLEVNRTTCTCTGIDLSHKSLAPGQTATAKVRYDAERALTGPYNQGGTVVTNDPEHREIYLGIKGLFTSPIVAEPAAVVFPTLHSAETQTAAVRFFGYDKPLLEITSAEWNDKEHFDFTFQKSELTKTEKDDRMKQNAGSVIEAKITVKPGLPLGMFQEKIYLKTNYTSEPALELAVRGQIAVSGISVTGMGFAKDTGTLLLGTVSKGKTSSRDVSVQFIGTTAAEANLRVKEVKPDFLKTTLTQPKDVGSESSRRRFYTLTLEVPATAPVCNYIKSDEQNIAMVILETGLKDSPVIKIPVQFAVEQ